jgi:hypothetical protein
MSKRAVLPKQRLCGNAGEEAMSDQTFAGMIAALPHEGVGWHERDKPDKTCVRCQLEAIETRLRGLQPNMNELRQVAKNCLTRWADPRNASACDEQLHVPEFYTQIVKVADTLEAILGGK